jgi:phosphatidylglycerophosphatase A
MKRLLTSCFGLGWLPLCPGTWGSLPPTIIFALLCHFKTPAWVISVVMTVLAMAGSIICVRFAPSIIAATGKKDPREVVADEFAGQALTFLIVPLIPWNVPFLTTQNWAVVSLGFLLFRLFDIVKPWPIYKLEKLPSGWGILADDVLAGVYAAAILLICTLLWII